MIEFFNFNLIFIFFIGFINLFFINNYIKILISFEIILLSLMLLLISLTIITIKSFSLIQFLLITIVAASETAIGLIIIISTFKLKGDISILNLNLLK